MKPKEKEKTLDSIINKMVEVVENSKNEIFNISEDARDEYNYLVAELEVTKEKVIKYIEDGDRLEKKVRLSRQRLSQVSKYFDKYSESEIREVYEKTHAMQTRLAVLRQEESALRNRRDEIERRLLSLNKTIERAENLVSKISVILPYLHDEFRQVNDMIKDAKEKQQFSLKIIGAQEDERRKISREIHDGPAQMMANILLRSELIERAFRNGSVVKAIEEIKSIRKMIRSSLYEVRRIIYDLRPMALDDLGLIPTIKRYVTTIGEYHNMNIEFTTISQEKRLNSDYEVALFRLIQESLQNAIKHSEATLIKVKLDISEKSITAVISDNGIGFDPQLKRDNSFGLIGMRERVEMLEGILKINSAINKGTQVYINVPYIH